jgi:hypothetical protein
LNYALVYQQDLFTESPPPIDELLAQIGLHVSLFWDPSEEDLEALCAAVNRRAKRALLTHDGRTVIPL